jgi:hypothetical protein
VQQRVVWVTCFVVCAGCRCGQSVQTAGGALTAQPAALDFGKVAVGASLDLSLTLNNEALFSQQVTLRTTAPFDVMSMASVGGGSSAEVRATFRPTAVGPQQGAVLVDVGELKAFAVPDDVGVVLQYPTNL